MNTKFISKIAMLVLIPLVSSGCNSTTKEENVSKVKYSSPQSVFDAAKTSVDNNDWLAFCLCLDPDSRDKFTASFAMRAVFNAEFADGDAGKKQSADIKAVFAKHGITEEMLGEDSDPARSMEEAMMEFIKPIKDRMAFVKDMGEVNGEELKKSWPIKGDTKLSDVKIDGETAKGTMSFKMGDRERTDTLDFKMADGNWTIVMMDKR